MRVSAAAEPAEENRPSSERPLPLFLFLHFCVIDKPIASPANTHAFRLLRCRVALTFQLMATGPPTVSCAFYANATENRLFSNLEICVFFFFFSFLSFN